jgi:hypothetical protein
MYIQRLATYVPARHRHGGDSYIGILMFGKVNYTPSLSMSSYNNKHVEPFDLIIYKLFIHAKKSMLHS